MAHREKGKKIGALHAFKLEDIDIDIDIEPERGPGCGQGTWAWALI
jgi:hypothetical protein